MGPLNTPASTRLVQMEHSQAGLPAPSPATPGIPEGLGPLREAVFTLPEPVCFSKEDFDRYWPYCDNIWSTRKRLSPTRLLYRCRLERASRPKPKLEGVKHRNRALREKRCSAHMVMETFEDGSVKMRRRGETGHAHNLEAVDRIKVNSALKTIEKAELAKGLSVLEVWSSLTGLNGGDGRRLLEQAGGRNLDTSHIYNQGLLLRKDSKYSTDAGSASNDESATEPTGLARNDQDGNVHLGPQDSSAVRGQGFYSNVIDDRLIQEALNQHNLAQDSLQIGGNGQDANLKDIMSHYMFSQGDLVNNAMFRRGDPEVVTKADPGP